MINYKCKLKTIKVIHYYWDQSEGISDPLSYSIETSSTSP